MQKVRNTHEIDLFWQDYGHIKLKIFENYYLNGDQNSFKVFHYEPYFCMLLIY